MASGRIVGRATKYRHTGAICGHRLEAPNRHAGGETSLPARSLGFGIELQLRIERHRPFVQRDRTGHVAGLGPFLGGLEQARVCRQVAAGAC